MGSGLACDALLRDAHAQTGRGARLDCWRGGVARRGPVRVVAVGRSGRAAGQAAPRRAGRGAGDGGGGRRADGVGAGRPLRGGAARVGAGIWDHAAIPIAAWPVSAEPQSDVRRGGCCLAWLGSVLWPPACLGGAGHRVRCLSGDRAVGGAAALGPVRRWLPGLPGGGSSLGAARRAPGTTRCRCIDRPLFIRKARAEPADLARFHCRLAVGLRRTDLEFMGEVTKDSGGRAADHCPGSATLARYSGR
jgi:hypothetical protein